MAKTYLKWVLLTLLIAYVIGASLWARGEAMKNTCDNIDVQIMSKGNVDSVTSKGVLAEIGAYPGQIKGIPSSMIDTKAIETYLSKAAHFEKVECAVGSDGTLFVKVMPMIPELRVFENGRSYYINKDGKEIDSKASFYVDVPVVTGNFSKNFHPVDLLNLIRFINNDKTLSHLIGMVSVADPQNIILVPRIQGHVINFGDTTRLQDKRDALLAMYKKVIPYKGWECYDTISVKFRGQVVATRRDKTPRDHGGVMTEEIDLEEATLPEPL